MNFRLNCATLGAVVLTISSCLSLQGETVNGGVLTAFPSLGSASSPTYGNAYWNNPSGDGPAANIGWCLTGGGQCALPGGAPGPLQYYSATGAAGGGNAPSNLSFTGTTTGVSPTLLVQLTSQSPNDSFGWYAVDPTTGGIVGSLHQLFSGNVAVATAATFTPPAGDNYGFYIAQQQGSSTDPFSSQYFFLMNSTANFTGGNDKNNPGDNVQHFAVFQQDPNSFYVGAVDTRACSAAVPSSCINLSNFDYQDMVVHVAAVPEPVSLTLIGGGLLLGACFRRKRKTI